MIYIVYRLLIEYAGILYADCHEPGPDGRRMKKKIARTSENLASERFEVSIDVE